MSRSYNDINIDDQQQHDFSKYSDIKDARVSTLSDIANNGKFHCPTVSVVNHIIN